MTHDDRAIDSHYGIGGLLQSILDRLVASGIDCDAVGPADLAPVDEFHSRGKATTLELALPFSDAYFGRSLDRARPDEHC